MRTKPETGKNNEDFINKLLDVSNSSQNIQLLLDIGYQELGNPLLLVDVALCFVAQTGGGLITDEPLWDWTLSKGYVTEEYVKYVLSGDNTEYDLGEDWSTGDSRLIWQDGLLHHRQLVGKINRNGIPIGYLKLLEYNQPITDEAVNRLKILCKFLAICMNASIGTSDQENSLIDTLLTSMLTQRLYDKYAIDERVNRFGLKLYENLSVIVLGTRGLVTDKIYFIKKKMKNFLNRETVITFKGNLVILYDCKTKVLFTKNELIHLEKLCTDYDIKAGISNSFKEIYKFELFYRQALTALELSTETNSKERAAYYDEFCVHHMVRLFSEHSDPMVLIHSSIKFLKEHDKENSSELCPTLKAYIKYNQDLQLTSSSLHIHYNTLKYRINKIIELTDLAFSDKTIFRLHLSFLVSDYLTETGKSNI
ncbi:helix-turn-helix domain-containing protein [Clostridium sp. E02]|uniref:PucR family transcriptional regulator n=1 Tax=Clostridium sp. E02 TaxID=2487134 RepID=UPI000F5279B9|nr:helix-turn-helix domain-containing protein [Clostridium sp. E02]